MRIVQLLPTFAYGDAIGNDVIAIDHTLKAAGYCAEIFAEDIDSKLPRGIAKHVGNLTELHKDDILLYHASTGSKLNYELPKFSGKQVVIYHNITPPHFFHNYNSDAEKNCAYGYNGMKFLAEKIQYCIADSEYNKQDLVSMGYHCPIDVCPIIIPFEDYEKKPDHSIISKYKSEEWTNLLFVGRIAPNKKQEDIIRAFYIYQKHYNSKSRLFLVGNNGGMQRYDNRLKEYTQKLGVSDKVFFSGHVSFSSILSYYQIADIFVCMSEHEGFCVPVVEAMIFGIPIVAYKSSAVPETLGKGGILLESKDPYTAASAINRIIEDTSLRRKITEDQKIEMKRFEYKNVEDQFVKILQNILSRK